jgi:hypothetical protein
MISRLRQRFNRQWTPEKYRRFLGLLDERCGTHVKFRVCETPVFLSGGLLDTICRFGVELVGQLLGSAEYLAASKKVIPFAFDAPNEDAQPLFVCADFGLARTPEGSIAPKLVEIQAFPSLFAFQTVLAQTYGLAYDFGESLPFLLDGLDLPGYWDLLRRAVVGRCDPGETVLLEIDPLEQKTLPDFLVTEKLLGIRTVNFREVARDKRTLYYLRDGVRTPIRRIYNRAIVDELVRKGIRPAFSFRDELDVEWAGHPNWFFRISKFSIPFLRHECVPRTWFLDQFESLPDDLHNYVLKPLFSFAGLGVIVGPRREEVENIPEAKRSQYILQERVDFAPLFDTPHGPTKAEIRILYIWEERLRPVNVIVRMGRGAQMGVDHNRDMEWVGASAAFHDEE